MNPEIAKLEASLADAKQKAESAEGKDQNLNAAVEAAEKALAEALSQDPAKKELDKVKGKKSFTRKERLEFEARKINEQLKQLESENVDKDTPVTVGMLEDREKNKQKNDAIEIAEKIEDATERELVIYQLENIITGGTAEERLKVARGYVNSVRNAKIAEELARKTNPKTANSPGVPPRQEEKFEPTAEEAAFMQPPYNLTKDDILKNRAKKAQSGIE